MPAFVHQTDLVYFPVPKIACTSIKTALILAKFPDLEGKLPHYIDDQGQRQNVHMRIRTERFTWRTPIKYYNGRWFCVVRDPVRRFLSGYTNRVQHHKDLRRSDPEQLKARGLSPRPELDEFIFRLKDYIAINNSLRHHFLPMVAFLGRAPRRFDRVFAMHDLTGLEAYCAQAGQPISLPHLQSHGPKPSQGVLDKPMRDALLAFYAADYAAFGRHLE